MTDMQPENSRVPSGPEIVPTSAVPGGERIPVLPTPEGGIEAGAEHFEQRAEASAAAADFAAPGMPAPQPTVIAVPVPVLPASDTPATAADEDVIEKEWVDKAKKIILETKDDPFGRSVRVNELQRDYLQKRYNKNLGASE